MSISASTDFSRRLREDAQADWGSATGHRFVGELFAGSLDDRVLTHYLVQDYQFFDPFLRLLGEAVATAPSGVARLRLGRQLGMLTTEENGYFERTLNALDVSLDDRLHPPLGRATVDLLDLMYEAIASHSWPHVLSVLLVLEWVYLDWAEAPDRPVVTPRDAHREWIDLHRGHEFRDWVTFLRQQLDAAEPSDEQAAEHCRTLFHRTVRAEVAFFDAAYDAAGSTGPARKPQGVED
ncbi:TenA family protein [Raineyella fluvialis]|uniref:Aminopyrimidine aminohydrolase n=1 Tax=Raineyella fluvialis TaxID=2662261 RepID=A0A5Q2FBD4_9ACTN|nr:TenA family protein [Raineyella fluvialis]QGF23711.1 TenA family transcriptional regulator [Raineyella fluvialis]